MVEEISLRTEKSNQPKEVYDLFTLDVTQLENDNNSIHTTKDAESGNYNIILRKKNCDHIRSMKIIRIFPQAVLI